ncbi:hypothetical protein M2152_001015 [Microbacteriaceae bacterium SG_E_30_P1]|uniref:DUF3043 domain-containing protein n=1 Tax=Antiquaquibacter oligotrophicus TaxID=2880260 RepID=A0ABT6KN18_9MICO|nr:DUF3043 domain-containing protein [Antiquaquibacter oligotrophicus]MDH6180833.1 hypothetical protein [Antiquaquibacter oligotrophicus]UDF13451.1 DUF3043 domain-containing protein [Antiquaquibacter oligotrophicus]
MAKTPPSTPTDAETASEQPTVGKGRPTPTRREKEEARKRPLVTNDRAEARRKARAEAQAQRERARAGMARGDEKFLPMRDRGPQKKFVRDYVDARFSFGELLIPLMFVVIILTFIPDISVQYIGIVALWAFFIVAAADAVLLGFQVTRKLRQKFGEDRAEKVRWYAAMRALQLRMMRLPKPQVKRGQYPE